MNEKTLTPGGDEPRKVHRLSFQMEIEQTGGIKDDEIRDLVVSPTIRVCIDQHGVTSDVRGSVPHYLVFQGTDYDSGGGWDDFLASCHTLEEAMAVVKRTRRKAHVGTWWQIVDVTKIKYGAASDDAVSPVVHEESK